MGSHIPAGLIRNVLVSLCSGVPWGWGWGGVASSPDHQALTSVVSQWTVAGLPGPLGQSAWAPAAVRASSGLSGALTTHASLVTDASAVASTAKPAGTG